MCLKETTPLDWLNSLKLDGLLSFKIRRLNYQNKAPDFKTAKRDPSIHHIYLFQLLVQIKKVQMAPARHQGADGDIARSKGNIAESD